MVSYLDEISKLRVIHGDDHYYAVAIVDFSIKEPDSAALVASALQRLRINQDKTIHTFLGWLNQKPLQVHQLIATQLSRLVLLHLNEIHGISPRCSNHHLEILQELGLITDQPNIYDPKIRNRFIDLIAERRLILG